MPKLQISEIINSIAEIEDQVLLQWKRRAMPSTGVHFLHTRERPPLYNRQGTLQVLDAVLAFAEKYGDESTWEKMLEDARSKDDEFQD